MSDEPYGWELIMDLHDCNTAKFNREDIEDFLTDLCELIEMDREDLYFWDYEDDPVGKDEAPSHLKGTSAVQFILTSTIVIHTLDTLKKVYLNLFSCKEFNAEIAVKFIAKHFEGTISNWQLVERM